MHGAEISEQQFPSDLVYMNNTKKHLNESINHE